ncbi:MAG: ImmA/IrrE family metallo-endopeptidase [Acidobacteria bacterium]|nr:ImmA/IrrE family metallo-endopeptidase [Acidobacteriota bacterium]
MVPIISNERQAREAANAITGLDEALSSEVIFSSIAAGLPRENHDTYRRSLRAERDQLSRRLQAFEKAREGDLVSLKEQAGSDLGSQLIIARIAKGYTHKQLARKLGLQEQAIQRYEAERYRTISLSGFQRVAAVLDLKLTTQQNRGVGNDWGLPFEVDHSTASKVLKHARAANWIGKDSDGPEEALDAFRQGISDHLLKHGKPSLLRTGLGVHDVASDLAVVAWKAQVSREGERRIKELGSKFRVTNIAWLAELAQMSSDESFLSAVSGYLAQHGIILIYEPAVPGTKLDGASFLLDGAPVVGLTLRKDTIDGFWFTLFHELAHVVLHYWTGLQDGFFDDLDQGSLENVEQEANGFAGAYLIPNELWIKSPARIAKDPEPIQNLAKQLGIHPAIVFGRIRMERNNYRIFADRIGQGKVRKALLRISEVKMNDVTTPSYAPALRMKTGELAGL